jgi:protein TonB
MGVIMSAHAYSTGSRRHARHHVRDTTTEQQQAFTRKKADVVMLVPRQQKLGQLTQPKSHKGIVSLTLLLVGIAHIALAWQLTNQPEPVITKAEVPPMTVEFYKPSVEQPPQPEQPKDEPPPPKPEPVVEKPKPVVKKEAPKPVEPKPEPVQVAAPEPIPAPPAPTPPAEPVLTKATADAGYLRNPAPRYPDFAQRQGWEGTVILNVHVLANGKPKAVEIKQSSGRKILDDSAVQAVKRWSFVPAKLGETATDSWVEVPIDFRLSQ